MISHIPLILLLAALATTSPIPLGVTSLNQAATDEAQQRDATATRAFTGAAIKTSDGQCLFVDELSGDFRANLTPVQAAACDGSKGQTWDVLTSGKHNDQPGKALIVNGLTQACMNFDPRRTAGDQVNMFSCGGRADGEGKVTDSQLFPLAANGTAKGGATSMSLSPANSPGTCLELANGRLNPANCARGAAGQTFTIG